MTKPEGPAQEPQMSEPTHKLPESLPYSMMIGDLRRCLFTQGDSAWNGYVRDMTAELEQPGEYVNVAEAFSRINAKAAKMMGVLAFQKAMAVPTPPVSPTVTLEDVIAKYREACDEVIRNAKPYIESASDWPETQHRMQAITAPLCAAERFHDDALALLRAAERQK